MKETWKDAVHQQRITLAQRLSRPLEKLAVKCEPAWSDRQELDKALLEGFSSVPNALYMYIVDTKGIQNIPVIVKSRKSMASKIIIIYAH